MAAPRTTWKVLGLGLGLRLGLGLGLSCARPPAASPPEARDPRGPRLVGVRVRVRVRVGVG
eukprot:scaffold48866_cov33-Phaeocystis_antarctica.AAC.1